jgi:putative component of toxin-antitoxin plasmid stabilization module
VRDGIRIVTSYWFDEEFHALPEPARKRINRRLLGLQVKGWTAALADGTIDHLEDGIWEVRVPGTGPAYRLLFFPAPGRAMRLVVLTSCLSKTAVGKRRLLSRAIERAKRRRDLWIEKNTERDDER